MPEDVMYHCQNPDCRKGFVVQQGSRAKYCPACIRARQGYRNQKQSAVTRKEREAKK